MDDCPPRPSLHIARPLQRMVLWLALCVLATTPLLPLSQIHAQNQGADRLYTGEVERFPDSGMFGRWQIGDGAFVVDDRTTFGEGDIAIGTCVSVMFSPLPAVQQTDTPIVFRAVRIALSDDCDDDDDDDLPEPTSITGSIEAVTPAFGDTPRSILVDDDTILVPDTTILLDGVVLAVGRCVTARVLELENLQQDNDDDFYVAQVIGPSTTCRNDDDDDDNDDDDDPPDPTQAYTATGRVNFLPEGEVGEWIIGRQIVVVSADTRLTEGITQGSCVDVRFTRMVPGDNAFSDADDFFDDDYLEDDAHGPVVALSIALANGCDTPDTQRERDVGIVRALPADLIGRWQVGNEIYRTTRRTEFIREAGRFAVGQCVVVVYRDDDDGARVAQDDTDIDLAVSIRTVPRTVCTDDDTYHTTAVLHAFPAGLNGLWTIGDSQYDVMTSTTRLLPRSGAFSVGACVHVVYEDDGNDDLVYPARVISSAPLRACGLPDDDIVTDTLTLRAAGVISARPDDGLFGTWAIAEGTFAAVSGTTRFARAYGRLEVGSCARVVYTTEGTTNIALRIISAPRYACYDEDDGERQPLTAYGRILRLADTPNRLGIWRVGDYRLRVTSDTDLEDGPFRVGTLVEITIVPTGTPGLFLALDIDARRGNDNRPERSKQVGLIDNLPRTADLSGTWTIASTAYTVTAQTRLAPRGTPFAAEDCVAVSYRILANGTRVTDRIERVRAERCQEDDDDDIYDDIYDDDDDRPRGRIFGYVERMPDSGFVGLWRIDGQRFEVRATVRVNDSLGLLLRGAFVGLTYYEDDNGVAIVEAIRAYVPPGAGRINVRGLLLLPNDNKRNLAQNSPTTWTIGGAEYTLSEATILDDSAAPFADGQLVQVNAYTDADGTTVATEIVTLGNADTIIYLPVVKR